MKQFLLASAIFYWGIQPHLFFSKYSIEVLKVAN